MIDLDALNFGKADGFVTVVTQDAVTGQVLMLAHADREALVRTITSGEMHYRSRARGPWHKGATSGNVQRVVSLSADCDGDAVLARVLPAGPSCHSGTVSCFSGPAGDTMTVLDRMVAADAGYTRRLLDDRNLRLKKLGEEAAELVIACSDGDAARATEEAADVIYHTIVAVRALGVSFDDVRHVLDKRRR